MGASTGRKTIGKDSPRTDGKTRTGPVRVFIGGTFDGLHSGHLFLVNYARTQGTKLARRSGRDGVQVSAVIARDDSVLRIKNRAAHHNQEERRLLLASLRTVDHVIIGVPNDFIQSVRRVDPDLIVLGYDQRATWEGALRDAGIDAKIIRCPAYQQGRLKSSKLRGDLVSMPT